MTLADIIKDIKSCTKCDLYKSSTQAVPGEGPAHAEIMLVGQNPGTEEDKTGRPFVGRAGRYLNKILQNNHINRHDLFITSVVKHKTPENRKPTRAEIEACVPYLIDQIKEIDPKTVVLMGRVAWKVPHLDRIEYIETYHPAAAMRFPRFQSKFEADFQIVRKKL